MPVPPGMPLAGRPGPLVEVGDPDDARLAAYRDLNDPAGRRRIEDEEAIFVVEGTLAVERLLLSRYQVHSMLVDVRRATAAAELVEAVRASGAPVYVGTPGVVTATVGFTLHRGVVAVAHRGPAADADRVLADTSGPVAGGGPPVVAVLEGLNDHENVGALFRNAAAFGVGAVLLDPTCADPLYRRSVRVSMGHVLHVPFARLTPWPAALDRIRAAGLVVAALTPDPDPDPDPVGTGRRPAVRLSGLRAWASDRGAGVALLLGAEGPGLSDAALSGSDVLVSIPMAGGVDSLNVATAAAVAFHALAGS